jgi:Ca2+-binding RTX toxin-like protein
VLNGGEDNDPDTLFGGGGNDILFAIRFAHPRQPSGAGRMFGGGGSDLLVGGQPCDGDTFDGGPGRNDSASFARVKNNGIVVSATIGGAVTNPDEGPCNAGHIDGSIEKIEGSSGSDRLTGDNGNNDLLGRGGNDLLNGRGGRDTCIGGGGNDRAVNCEHKGSL